MAKKNSENTIPERIHIEDLKVDGTYMNYVGDMIKILDINHKTKTVRVFNITGVFRQWLDFKYIYMVRKIR